MIVKNWKNGMKYYSLRVVKNIKQAESKIKKEVNYEQLAIEFFLGRAEKIIR